MSEGSSLVRTDKQTESYFDLYQDYWSKTGKEESVQSRFWFRPSEPVFASREGIAVIQDMKIMVNIMCKFLRHVIHEQIYLKQQIKGHRQVVLLHI